MTAALPFAGLLTTGKTILLDGAVGTELDRRGVRTALPLWSAIGLLEAPSVVGAIHRDYVRAGADILIANTFRTTRRTLAKAGEPVDRAAALNRLAISLARDAAMSSGRTVLVAGSLAPLEDCYSPWLSPPFEIALNEHRDQALLLAQAGADFLMVETMPCATEAEAAIIAARETGLEVTAGFVLGADGCLLSGEPLAKAVPRIVQHGISAVVVNCSPAAVIARALPELRSLTDLPLGGYANLGVADPIVGWAADMSIDGDAYAASVSAWIDLGARLVGGCCGTRPEHIASLRRLLDLSRDRWES